MVAVVVAAVLAVAAPSPAGAQARPGPGPLKVAVSGDILVHEPIWERARHNGGGAYDFRPMFRYVRPLLREADLAPTPPVKRTAVRVDPKLFDAYVGRYELEPEFTVAITRDGDRLFAQATGQGRLELLPQSEASYFAEVMDIVVTFAKDASGTVTHFTVQQDGRDRAAKRIKCGRPARADDRCCRRP